MQTEIEAKFTNIDPEDMRSRLRGVGAKLIYPERIMRRNNFDHPGVAHAWIRVRHEGDKVTLTYKRTFERTLHGTKEINLVVDDDASAVEFLEVIGLTKRSVQETKRELWEWNNCEITIDTWPWVPPFLEIEGASEEDVRATAAALGIDFAKAMFGSIETVYQEHFDVTEEEVCHWPSITFVPVPEWLEQKRKRESDRPVLSDGPVEIIHRTEVLKLS